jgi:hypothetical protein
MSITELSQHDSVAIEWPKSDEDRAPAEGMAK